MRFLVLLMVVLLPAGWNLRADPPLQAIEPIMADEQMALLNKLVYARKQPAATNQLQTISLNSILSAVGQGYSGKEIYEMANRTNDPRLPPQLRQLGGYQINPAVRAFLSPMSPKSIAEQTAPTPEPTADLKLRMENLARMQSFSNRPTSTNDDVREMMRVYQEAERMQMRAMQKAAP